MFQKANDLTKDETTALTELRAGIMWAQPFFSHLLLDQCNLVSSRDVPYAATDGKNIFLNPATFAKWNLQQRLYVLCHEICHVMWEHCEQAYIMKDGIFGPNGMLPSDPQLINEVQDWVINAFLDECKIGAHPPEGHFNPRIKGGESWVGVYAEEYARRMQSDDGGGKGGGSSQQPPGDKPGGGQPQQDQGVGQNPGGFDDHLQPGAGDPAKTPQQAVQERKDHQAEMAQAINQAFQVAKARGEVPGAIQRLVEALIMPKVDWKDRLAALVTKNVGGGNYDWRSPDPTMMIFADPVYTPRRSGLGVGTAVLVRDTSGSVGRREMQIMGGCMAGIFEQAMPETAYVLDCDADVHQVIELDNPTDIDAAEVSRRSVGGGGTRFEPAFEKLDELGIRPDCLVYLTDGYGSFPRVAPAYPVIWAIIPGGKNSCPWGEVVEVEV